MHLKKDKSVGNTKTDQIDDELKKVKFNGEMLIILQFVKFSKNDVFRFCMDGYYKPDNFYAT